MNDAPPSTGPEIALVGAARSGTTYLASVLASHPQVQAPALKEPNFFSMRFDRGFDWYDALFPDRRSGTCRLDASTSYSFPDHTDALPRLAAAAPHALIVYIVRDPLERAYSHYRHRRFYLGQETGDTFAEALRATPVLLEASDYGRVLGRLRRNFSSTQILIVPFELLTKQGNEAAVVIAQQLGINTDALPYDDMEDLYRNNAVGFRNQRIAHIVDRVRRSSAYPTLRARIGSHRVRALRARLTTKIEHLTLEQALASCDAEQYRRLQGFRSSTAQAVHDALAEQDSRLSLEWSRRCSWVKDVQ